MDNVKPLRNSSRTADGLMLARFLLVENRLALSSSAHHVLLTLLAVSHDAKSMADPAWLVSRTGFGPGTIDQCIAELAREGFLEIQDGKTVTFDALSRLALAWSDEVLAEPEPGMVEDVDPADYESSKSVDASGTAAENMESLDGDSGSSKR